MIAEWPPNTHNQSQDLVYVHLLLASKESYAVRHQNEQLVLMEKMVPT